MEALEQADSLNQTLVRLRSEYNPAAFGLKDSGERTEFSSGMRRDVSTNKTLWHLTSYGPMPKRLAEHLTKGANKYDRDRKPGDQPNWMKAEGVAEYERFRESAYRHFMQWWNGDRDEDHAAAVFFNINGAEYVLERNRNASEADGRILDVRHVQSA